MPILDLAVFTKNMIEEIIKDYTWNFESNWVLVIHLPFVADLRPVFCGITAKDEYSHLLFLDQVSKGNLHAEYIIKSPISHDQLEVNGWIMTSALFSSK